MAEGNGHTPTPTADRTTSPSSRGSAPPAHRLQNEWLRRMQGKAVTIRLRSGEVITGTLTGDDTYTLALTVPGSDETALVYKHSIEYLVANRKRPNP